MILSVETFDRYGNATIDQDASSLIVDLLRQPKGSEVDDTLVAGDVSDNGVIDFSSEQLIDLGAYVFVLHDTANPGDSRQGRCAA